MRKRSRVLGLASAVLLLVSCVDPSGPRIPTPEKDDDDGDDRTGVVTSAFLSPDELSQILPPLSSPI
jgi:hypothetical protein